MKNKLKSCEKFWEAHIHVEKKYFIFILFLYYLNYIIIFKILMSFYFILFLFTLLFVKQMEPEGKRKSNFPLIRQIIS